MVVDFIESDGGRLVDVEKVDERDEETNEM